MAVVLADVVSGVPESFGDDGVVLAWDCFALVHGFTGIEGIAQHTGDGVLGKVAAPAGTETGLVEQVGDVVLAHLQRHLYFLVRAADEIYRNQTYCCADIVDIHQRGGNRHTAEQPARPELLAIPDVVQRFIIVSPPWSLWQTYQASC